MKVIDRFVIERSESKGKKCEYFKAKDRKTGEVVCIKSISMKTFEKYPNYHTAIMNEIKFWQKFPLEDLIIFKKALKSKTNFYIIMEYAEQGSLEKLIKRNIFLEEAVSLRFFIEVIDIFQSLMQCSILHRHVKPSNFLLIDGRLKLSDFKYCVSCDQSKLSRMPPVGCPLFTCPEVIRGHGYNKKSDIWSIGCLLYTMLFGSPPINGRSMNSMKRLQKKFKLKFDQRIQKIHKETRLLLTGMLQIDPKMRICWKDLYEFKMKISWELTNANSLGAIDNSVISGIKNSAPYFPLLEKFHVKRAFLDFQRLISEAFFINQQYTDEEESKLRRYRLKIRMIVYLIENLVCKKFHKFSHVYHQSLYFLIATVRLMGIKLFNYLKDVDPEEQNSAFGCHVKESIFEEINKFDAPYKILKANNPELPSDVTPEIFFEEMQKYVNYLIEEIIKNEDDEMMLKTAIFQANLVLDTLMIDLTTCLFYRLDQQFSEQKYPRYLSRINYKSLVDLMNAKLKYFSIHSESFLDDFSIE